MIFTARRLFFFSAVLSAAAPLAAATEPLVVCTVNYPLAYFAERIGGEEVRVMFPAPADVDPAFWRPDADTVRDYQAADLILLNGADYAKWVSSVSLPRRRLVNTSRAAADDYLASQTGVAHSHGPGGGDAHAHSGTAFTLWLDPVIAMTQTAAIENAFARARPGSAAVFQRARKALDEDLRVLDEALAAAFASLPAGPLLASHPVYQYLGQRYARAIDALLWEPDVTPDSEGWRDLDRLTAEGGVRWMLWEDEPTAATRDGLSQRGIGVIVFRPLGNRPASGDYLDGMRGNAASVAAAGADG